VVLEDFVLPLEILLQLVMVLVQPATFVLLAQKQIDQQRLDAQLDLGAHLE
jgi:hypothetical protein